MKKEPLVSIVMPTHNGRRYIASSIESCLKQTHANLEVIVVDDASTDDTTDHVAPFAARDSRVRLIQHKINRRISAALNTGFAEARGDYLTWTSDDNAYRPEAIARMVQALETQSEISFVYTDFILIDDDDRVLRRQAVEDRDSLLNGNCVGACFMYRRKVYETIGDYDESRFLVEDYDYWLRIAALFKIQPIHEDLYLYRFHGGSLTAKNPRIDILKNKALYYRLRDLKWVGLSRRSDVYQIIAECARDRGDRRLALKSYARTAVLRAIGLIGKAFSGHEM